MGLRQRDWARRERDRLIDLLGSRCALCGSKRRNLLTFDCIVPQGDSHHKIEWSWRISFYRQQLQHGNLQLACESCNSAKSNRVPF